MLKPFSQLPCFITSTLSLRLTVTSSAQLTLTPPHPLFCSSVTTFWRLSFCLCGNYPKAHISWKVHHHDPNEFLFHGSCWDCLESVVESVWQPAVSCAALHSCGIITGYLCFPDSQLFSLVWLMVLCGQSCVKNLALCRRSWEDTLVAGRIQQCCWSYNLFAVLEAWR